MMKITAAFLVVLFAIASGGNVSPVPEQDRQNVKGPECVTNRNYESLNIDAAMTGYDNFIGNPFDTIVDPGAKSTIFLSDCDKGNDTGFYDFISTAYSDLNCHSDFSMKTFTKLSEYDTERTQSVEASLSGSITASVEAMGNSAKASRSFSLATNSDERAAYKVLEEMNGEIVLAEATCITETVSIAEEVRPVFSKAFINHLVKLHQVSSSDNNTEKDNIVREFIHEFGTSFMQETKLGASLAYERRFTTTSKGTDEGSDRSGCVKAEASLAIEGKYTYGVAQMEGSASLDAYYNGCSSVNANSKFGNEQGIESTRLISRGSRPLSLAEWVTADFVPVPIKRYLTPLSALFKNEWLTKNTNYGFDETLSGTEMAIMFNEVYSRYCSLMLEGVLDDKCDLKDCKDYSCNNGGICELDMATGKPTCDCANGYYGDHCEQEGSCNDGIKNQNEEGIDCGGPCAACATCDDGIQNQNERGKDCGGVCAPCEKLTIPRDACEWRSESYGVWNQCRENELAIGSCGSGAGKQCKDGQYTHGIYCCAMPNYEFHECTQMNGAYGENLDCGKKPVGGECGSGSGKDCDNWSAHGVKCCDGTIEGRAVVPVEEASCYWKYTPNWGEDVLCQRNDEAVFGRCGSGSNKDCENGYVHGIKCCEIESVDEFVESGFQLITKEKGPAKCGKSLGCDNGDKEFQINRCISEGCNLIRWCPKNGEGLDEPSCHLRNSDSRACIYKDCDSCTKDSCDYDKDPNNDDDGNPIGHWYTYFKVKA